MINLREFIKKYQLIIFLSAIILILLVIKLTNKNTETSPLLVQPTPTQQPTPTVVILKPEEIDTVNNPTDRDPNYPLDYLLPYQTKNFEVKKYIEPLVLLIKINDKSNIEKIKTEAQEWVTINEIKIGSHKIVWEE